MNERAQRSLLAWLAHVAGPLGLGCALYLGARPRGLWFWGWARALDAEPALLALRAALAPLAAAPDWVAFVLPDALWAYALTAAVARLQAKSALTVRAAWLAVPLVMGPGAELLQLVGLPGTFDPLDLLATSAAFVLAVLATSVRAGRSRRAEMPAGS